jgi:hypothetical protein
MIPALGFVENCYQWGETNFLLTPHSRHVLSLTGFNRCIYVSVISAVIAPAGCLYHLFKSIQCKIEGRHAVSTKHFASAIRDSIAFLRGAVIPIIAIASIHFNFSRLGSAIRNNLLNEIIQAFAILSFGVYGCLSSHQMRAILPPGLKDVRLEIVVDQVYWTYKIEKFIESLW